MLVEQPLPADGEPCRDRERRAGHGDRGTRVHLLAQPENGCESVTQFVGYIPAGRAPDHFHRYDEVVYVLAGEGAFHVDDESAPLRPGSCFHLPARLVHCVENFGPDEMRVLGVFRPAGSPAEAYYPDGAAAVVVVPSDAAHRAHSARRLGREPRTRRRHARRRDRRVRAAALLPPVAVGDPGGKTSPEELLAAAHGGCITMSLAGELTPPRHRRAGSTSRSRS